MPSLRRGVERIGRLAVEAAIFEIGRVVGCGGVLTVDAAAGQGGAVCALGSLYLAADVRRAAEAL